MSELRTVILAAGQGKRLLPLTAETPKSLLDLNGKSVLERILDNAAECGVREAAIVVGFREEKIRSEIGGEYNGITITYISNPLYQTTNNIYSVWLSYDYVDAGGNGFTLINGDDYFDARILRALLESSHADAAVIDLDKKNLPDEAMKAKVRDGRLVAVSKKIPSAEASGDAIGIYKFSKRGAAEFFAEINGLLDEGQNNVFYLMALDKLVKRYDFFVSPTNGLMWGEIDDANDYECALKSYQNY